MSNIKIPELPEVTSLQDSDLFVVETSNGTRKLQKENLITDTTVDPTPTEGSENAVASGGVYTALSEKQEAPKIFDETLTAGNTTVTFTDDMFERDVVFTIFTDNENTIIVSAEHNKTAKTITIEILEAMPMDITVRVCVNLEG